MSVEHLVEHLAELLAEMMVEKRVDSTAEVLDMRMAVMMVEMRVS